MAELIEQVNCSNTPDLVCEQEEQRVKRPTVTVVVPTHNRPQLMRRAVQSVVRQSYEGEIEVLVVFDACELDDPNVELGPSRNVRILTNQRSRGLAGARNTGILNARSEYVAFLDDDDYWFPGKLEAQMERFVQDESTVLVASAIVLDDGTHQFERYAPSEVITYSDLLRDRIPGAHSSTFVANRGALIELGMVDECLPGSYGEDYDLLLRAAQIAPIVVVNSPLVSVTWATGSFFFGRWDAYAEGLEYLLARHPDFAFEPKAIGRLQAQIAFAKASAGHGQVARQWAKRALSSDPGQIKAWLAIAISLGLLRTQWIVGAAQKRGRGI